jgi:phosphate-selective porin OprO/OprP
MLIALQNFRWGSGFHYENFGLFDGRASLQMALTNNGLNDEGFVDHSLEDGMNFIARATGTILNDKEKHHVVHLGVNFDNRPYKDLKFRPENHLGSKYHYTFPEGDTRSTFGLELGTTFGPISIQGEYKSQKIDTPNKDYIMSSYYAFASYFITGEHRPYKHASFGRVKPKNDIDNGGMGALEVLARYSNMNASQDVLAANVGLPEDINNISLGLNWYLNSRARLMYNYVVTDDGNDTLGNLNQHLFRVQVDF